MGKNGFAYHFFYSPKLRWLRLLLLSVVIYLNLAPFDLITDENDVIGKDKVANINRLFPQLALVMTFVSSALVLLNLYVFAPKLLFARKYLYYLISVVAVTLVFFATNRYLFNHLFSSVSDIIPPIGFTVTDIVSACTTPIIFLAATTGFVIFKKWVRDQQNLSELKTLSLQNELNGLKGQVNPHFLFNTLNNLNTLIEIDKSKASEVVLGLSDLLRYQIYESANEKVSLKRDVTMLDEFLHLEKIRRDGFSYTISFKIEEQIEIPSLLFINFVENAAKHSLDNTAASYCNISIMLKNGNLLFECENSIPTFQKKSSVGGLGLANVSRRLKLLYGSNFQLKIDNRASYYSVALTIPLTN